MHTFTQSLMFSIVTSVSSTLHLTTVCKNFYISLRSSHTKPHQAAIASVERDTIIATKISLHFMKQLALVY